MWIVGNPKRVLMYSPSVGIMCRFPLPFRYSSRMNLAAGASVAFLGGFHGVCALAAPQKPTLRLMPRYVNTVSTRSCRYSMQRAIWLRILAAARHERSQIRFCLSPTAPIANKVPPACMAKGPDSLYPDFQAPLLEMSPLPLVLTCRTVLSRSRKGRVDAASKPASTSPSRKRHSDFLLSGKPTCGPYLPGLRILRLPFGLINIFHFSPVT